MVAKITFRSTGDPEKAFKGLSEKENRVYMGQIIGEANGIAKRTSADGDRVDEGLKGTFEVTTIENKTETSNQFFPSTAVAVSLTAPFRKKTGAPNSLLIGLDLFIVRSAKAASGYEWEITPHVMEEYESNALNIAREKMKNAKVKSAKTK